MFNTIGKRVPKYDGIGHVTGRTTYVDDIVIPGMQYIKVLRSPHHRADIISIDVSEAEKMPGVSAVLTYKDVPNNCFGYYADQPVLCEKHIRYKGENIAAVVAIDTDSALAALEKIKIEYEVLEPVFDPVKAMDPDSPQIRPEGNVWTVDGIMPNRQIRLGDFDEAAKKADHVITSNFMTTPNEHAALEPQVSVAEIDFHGRLVIHSVCQGKQTHLGFLASILKMPLNKITVKGGTVGGGFGGKHTNHADHVTALAALKTGKPCKWTWTREEEMMYSTWRGAWVMEFTDAVMNDGTIIGRKVKMVHDSGAYSALAPYALDKAALTVCGPYNIPNITVDAYCVYTDKSPSCAMRGFGINCGLTGSEVHIERVAKTIGVSSWDIRFMNSWREGDKTCSRQELKAVSTVEVLKEAARLSRTKINEKYENMTSESREGSASQSEVR